MGTRESSAPAAYAELHCHSAFSLLDGASPPEALVARAADLGLHALALTDHDDLGGVVRFAGAGRERGVRALVGAELTVGTVRDAEAGAHLVLLAESAAGYANLCTLVTRARMDRPRGEPRVPLDVVARHAEGLVALTGCPGGEVPSRLAAGDEAGARRAAFRLRDVFGDRLYVECWDHGLAEERRTVARLVALARALGRPWVVTNDVHYAEPGGRRAHDLLCALRHGLPLDGMGTRLRPNGEWYLKSARQVLRRWRHAPDGVRRTLEVAERCAFRLEQLRPSLPDFPLPPGVSADEYLARLTWQGADERWGAVLSEAQRRQLRHELGLIARLGLAGYFLIVWDIVRFARRNGILVQGRGSAANSAVCYCLGITAVDPIRMQLLFERFLSEGRAEPPDIDLDVAHRERERVLQYVYARYGREHAAMVCEQITWRGRSAVRDAARALGFTVEQAGALAALSDRFSAKATAAALRGQGAADAYTQPAEGCGSGEPHPAAAESRAEARSEQIPSGAARPRDDAASNAENVPPESSRGPAGADGICRDAGSAREGAAPGQIPSAAARPRDDSGAGEPSPSRPAGGAPAGRYAPRNALDFFDPSSRDRRDADKRALAHAMGQGMVGGTEAATTARAVKEAARRAWTDPHADTGHVERRNPTTSLVGSTDGESILRKAGLDPADRRVALLADLVESLHQLPRHRSIHVGGFVLTREPLSGVVPIEPASMPDRTVIQWEKDDLDPVGLVKIDILGLGMLTLLQDCLLYIRRTRGVALDLASIPPDDPAVYDVLCRADTVGLFQVESRAQMNTLPRMRPRGFYDLVVEVALIRPGPIQGDMVHPYLRRRAGEEPVTYPHPSLEPVLARTLGIPLFQEQGMQVAITAAGFTPAEADELRRAMGHKRSHERMQEIGDRLAAGMQRNGIEEETARRIYQQINAFADYGFPESHAASFALLVYASAWLRHYYAPEYTAAILNAQPMGFYSPGTLVEDARRHGVEVRPVDVTVSQWDTTLEGPAPPAVRLGLRTLRGLGAAARGKLERALAGGPFRSIREVVRRTGLDRRALRILAESGALDALVAHEPPARRRRAALWAVLRAERGDGPLFDGITEDGGTMESSRGRDAADGICREAGSSREGVPPEQIPSGAARPRDDAAALPASIPSMTPYELTEADYRMTALSLHGHPMAHLRARLRKLGVLTAVELRQARGGAVVVAGLVICRQRPGTAKGFVFLTLEDETGMVNVVIRPDRFEQQALLIARSPLLLVRGTLQAEGTILNVRAEEFEPLLAPVGAEYAQRHDFH